jgi:hypothetical protein
MQTLYLVRAFYLILRNTGAFSAEHVSHLMAIRNTAPFSAEHVRLLNEIKQDVMKFVLINIALLLVTLTLGFAKQALTPPGCIDPRAAAASPRQTVAK